MEEEKESNGSGEEQAKGPKMEESRVEGAVIRKGPSTLPLAESHFQPWL